MRITNRIMQNNSLYNINNNKVTEDAISTSIMTGKRTNRPSDDPVIAIRSLRLRANVTELKQYYEKNAKDADAWLTVTAGALDTTTGLLKDIGKLVTEGPDKYKTLSDWETIVTQIEQLADEYYATGNVDYAGRYVFTGFRTDTTLTYPEPTTEEYKNIHDEFNASDIGSSSRISNTWKFADGDETSTADAQKESDVSMYTVGRLRVSYDTLKVEDASKPEDVMTLKYRTPMTVPATSSVLTEANNIDTIDLSFTDNAGVSHTIHVPRTAGTPSHQVDITDADGNIVESYQMTQTGTGTAAVYELECITGGYGTFTINSKGVITSPALPTANVLKATASISSSKVAAVTFTAAGGTQETVNVPLISECKQPYNLDVGNGYTARVNTDGTFTLHKAGAPNSFGDPTENIVQITKNGSVTASYVETSLHPDAVITNTTPQADIDQHYRELDSTYREKINGAANPDYEADAASTKGRLVFNADTGELLMSKAMRDRLSTLRDITGANTMDVIYGKSEFKAGDTRPENLFTCTKASEGIIYNSGSGGHTMAYDVGYNQKIEVNTTAEQVFTNEVKRDAQDLRSILNQMKDVDAKLTILQNELKGETDDTKKTALNLEIDAAQKAYDYLAELMKDTFGNKITGTQKALDMANNAVTTNGTRAKRLELIDARLTDQTATFEELQSENEDVDLAEAGTMLSMARLTYEASLQATGKIMTTSLMDYI